MYKFAQIISEDKYNLINYLEIYLKEPLID